LNSARMCLTWYTLFIHILLILVMYIGFRIPSDSSRLRTLTDCIKGRVGDHAMRVIRIFQIPSCAVVASCALCVLSSRLLRFFCLSPFAAPFQFHSQPFPSLVSLPSFLAIAEYNQPHFEQHLFLSFYRYKRN
jgi:hypothetical protein